MVVFRPSEPVWKTSCRLSRKAVVLSIHHKKSRPVFSQVTTTYLDEREKVNPRKKHSVKTFSTCIFEHGVDSRRNNKNAHSTSRRLPVAQGARAGVSTAVHDVWKCQQRDDDTVQAPQVARVYGCRRLVGRGRARILLSPHDPRPLWRTCVVMIQSVSRPDQTRPDT